MIEVINLTIKYSEKTIINNLSFRIEKGSKLALKGRSGSGKSTILLSLLGFVKPAKGNIKINELSVNRSNIKKIRSLTAWVPQELSFDLRFTHELLMLPFNFKINKTALPSQKSVNYILEKFGLNPEILNEELKHISGGEKQRISLCSSLLQNKPIILLDEPTSALDNTSKAYITDIFMNNPNITVLSASHDDYWVNNNEQNIDITKYH